MYWTLASSIFYAQTEWDEQKGSLFEIDKILAQRYSKYNSASDQPLSEETKEKQSIDSKMNYSKYSNSFKKIVLYFSLISVIRQN